MFVQSIIHTQKLAGYLSVQAEESCSLYHEINIEYQTECDKGRFICIQRPSVAGDGHTERCS